jgi:mono/diheme cytochrome c family protein
MPPAMPPAMPSTGTSAARTGAIVSAGIAMAGTMAWLATTFNPARDVDRVAVDAAAPVDTARLRAGADPLATEQGRVYYVQLCMSCHGARGDGRGEWAYRVTPRPSNLALARTQARSDAELFEIISEPRPGTPMIGWKKQLSESQRRQLVTYVRHLGTAVQREARH